MSEQTGLDEITDKFGQSLSAVKFTFDDEGNIFEVLEEFSALEDPGMPISEVATEKPQSP